MINTTASSAATPKSTTNRRHRAAVVDAVRFAITMKHPAASNHIKEEPADDQDHGLICRNAQMDHTLSTTCGTGGRV